MKHLSWLTLLLCFCIAVVSFDKMPDPPAANQTTIRSQGVQFDHADCLNPLRVLFVSSVPKPHSPARWSIVRLVNFCAFEVPKLVRRASDSSPPNSTI
ncbi:MAG: hypothetical protein ACRD9L_08180 [Bryobacteraceae bacterium]